MKNIFIAIIFVITFSANIFANLAIIPLDEAISNSDAIVIGTLKQISEHSDKGVIYGKGEIIFEKLITGNIKTIRGETLKPNNKLQLNYIEDFPCIYGSHKRIENEKGIFMLTFDEKGEIEFQIFYSMESLSEIKKFLKKGVKTKGITKTIKYLEFDQQIPIKSQTEQTYENNFCELSIEKSSKNEYSPFQALLVILISFPTYYLLFRSRFKIR